MSRKLRMPDLNDLIQDLQLAKDMAIRNENITGLITATMAQAKLLGIDKPQPVINDDVFSLSQLIDEISNEASEV